MSKNRCIGKNNDLPWRYPEDLKFFKRTTLGHTVIMGRRTWDSIGRALPKRRNIVVSRNPNLNAPGAEVFETLAGAISDAQRHDEMPFVIGGAQLYLAALPWATDLFVTHIDRVVHGDTFFPEIDLGAWTERECVPGETRELRFAHYVRQPAVQSVR